LGLVNGDKSTAERSDDQIASIWQGEPAGGEGEGHLDGKPAAACCAEKRRHILGLDSHLDRRQPNRGVVRAYWFNTNAG
jgi:hypothetical protein